MARQHERHLEVLTAVGEGDALTQRALAERLGVALGLANLYLKRLAKKGYIKVTEFPTKPAAGKRLRYLLTPKGIAEKTRLTYAYMDRSLAQYRLARQTLRQALAALGGRDHRRVALFGAGEAAELAYLTLRELGLEPVGVFTEPPHPPFLGAPTRDWRELAALDLDGVVIATFDKPEARLARLAALGVPAGKLLTLRPRGRANGAR
jgi:DNA-binding MarR family transcriptional regulator